jgi:anti-anti-sigma regulatory factor
MVTLNNNTIILDNEKTTIEDKRRVETQLALLVNTGHTEIFVDLGMTSFLPSELLGLLMWKKRELRKKGITLEIVRISQTLKSLFDGDKISDYFEIDKATVTSFPDL